VTATTSSPGPSRAPATRSLAIDTHSSLDLRRLSTRELRAERDRLQRLLDQAPRDRTRELARASACRVEADQNLEQLTTRRNGPQRQNRGVLRLRRQEQAASVGAGAVVVARQQADRATEAELALRQHQQRRAGWLEAYAHLGPAYRQVMRELAWQRRAAGLAAEHDPPGYLLVSDLRKVRWEADQADEVLGIADVDVTAIVAVHGVSVPWGRLQADGATVIPARRLPGLLRMQAPVLGPERVAWLADRARLRFRPAA
jgi:hypothetical protein